VTQQETATRLATLIMWAATGRRYGPCEITIRPCQNQFLYDTYRAYPVWWTGSGYSGPYPFIFDGTWFNTCGCGPMCCCMAKCEVTLSGPVAEIISVLVNGEVVPSTDYRLDAAQGSYKLVRMTGGCWPLCQDFNQMEDGDKAFAITYSRGTQVPQSVLDATDILACEFAKQISGGDCGLPPRMQSLTRQGVSAEFIVSEIDVNTFQTGINLVDMVIRAENPSRRTRMPVVLSPDAPTVGDRKTVLGWGP
jgi:hypothetical protein